MSVKQQKHEIKRKQEKDFLNQVRELENLEQARKLAAVQAINQDFIYYNENLKKENQEKRSMSKNELKNDSYTYFPFVSGDVIEKHR